MNKGPGLLKQTRVQVFPEIICGCFFIISHPKAIEFSKSSIWKRKKGEVTKTWKRSRLGPETIRSRIFCLFSWAIATDYLYQHCACKRSLRIETNLSFRAFRVEILSVLRAYLPGKRLLVPSASKIPDWLFSLPRETRSMYFLGLGK